MKRALPILFATALSLFALNIHLPVNPAGHERTAGEQLQKYLPLLSGESLDAVLLQDGHGAPQSGDVCVGRTDESLRALGLSAWSDLQPDEVLYKVDDQGVLWIAGEGLRGVIYSVFEFLEQEYGARFFTESYEYLPKTSGVLTLPAKGTSHRYAPPIISRIVLAQGIVSGSPDFLVKTRNNYLGNFRTLSDDWGGLDGIIFFCHSMSQMITEAYFQNHPEWFALRDGLRQAGAYSQLCLTNQEMRQELTRLVLAALRRDGGRNHFISVSQNDNQRYCQCDACNAFVEAHGNQTDLLIDCVNLVAEAVEKEFPGVYVDTLAYNYTRQPPKTVVPRDNVAIRYCTIEAKSLYPLESTQNNDLFQELLSWKGIAKKMLIWNYITDFMKYYQPHPNFHNFSQDARFFQECNAINILQQGAHDAGGAAADLADLRNYVLSRLNWDPQADQETLVDEFLTHFYGPAKSYVRDYLDTITALAQATTTAADTCYALDTTSWLSDSDLASLWQRVYAGVTALQNDATYGPRMALAALPITMNLLERPELLVADTSTRPEPLQDVDPSALIDWCEKVLADNSITALNEGSKLTVKEWLRRRRASFSSVLVLPDIDQTTTIPSELLAKGNVWGWNIEDMGPAASPYASNTIELADDSAADGGKAFTMPNIHTQWFIQPTKLPNGICDVYLTVRADAKSGKTPSGAIFACGGYPAGPNYSSGDASTLVGKDYKLVYVGKTNLTKCDYFYVCPIINDTVERFWVDRFFIVNPTDDNGNAITPLE
jgi:hypothetical protein